MMGIISRALFALKAAETSGYLSRMRNNTENIQIH